MEILPADQTSETMSLCSSACGPQEDAGLWPQLYTKVQEAVSPSVKSSSKSTIHDENMGDSTPFYHYFDPMDSADNCPSCRQKQHGNTQKKPADVSESVIGPHSHRHREDCAGCCSHRQYQVVVGQGGVLRQTKGAETAFASRSKSGNSVPSFSTLSLLAHHHELEKPQKKTNEEHSEVLGKKRARARSHSFRCGDRGQYTCSADLHSRCGIWNPCCNCLFSAFPDIMIIQEIFSFLDKRSLLHAAQVCRRWNFLANSPKLWRQIVISDASETGKKSTSMINMLTKRSPSINSLSLRAPKFEPLVQDCTFPIYTNMVTNVDDVKLLSMLCDAVDLGSLYLTNLVKVDLSGMKRIPGEMVYNLLRYTRKLETLCLDGVAKMDDANLKKLIRHNVNLRELNIAHCKLISDDTILFCAEEDVRLHHLDVTSSNRVSIASIAQYLEKARHSIATLRIAGIKWVRDQQTVDRLMAAISSNCPHLQELDVSSRDTMLGNRLITDSHLGWMANGSLPNLQTLKIRSARGISSTGIIGLVRSFGAQLTSLDLSYCKVVDDAVIRTIASCCPRLEYLSLCNIKSITDEAVRELSRISSLGTVNLDGCSGLSTTEMCLFRNIVAPISIYQ